MEVKTIAFNALKSALGAFRKDLEALPDDAFDKSFGTATRTVADIVFEVCLVNDDICATMRGEEPAPWPEGWIKAPEGCRTKEAVLTRFEESSTAALAQVEAYSEAELAEKVVAEWGETDRFERCRFMAMHVWYHSGQLNFIQTLLGDSEWHWG